MNIIKMRYSVKLRDRIYVEGYGFLSFAKNKGKNLSNKYSQKVFDTAKKSTKDAIKIASKKVIQKTTEATGDLIGKKIADKITSISKKPVKDEDVEMKYQKMKYQKLANLLDNTSNEPSRFRRRNWVEINDDSWGTYTNSDIKFKSTMLKHNLCDYSDAYIIVKGKITITGAGDDAAARPTDEQNKGVKAALHLLNA